MAMREHVSCDPVRVAGIRWDLRANICDPLRGQKCTWPLMTPKGSQTLETHAAVVFDPNRVAGSMNAFLMPKDQMRLHEGCLVVLRRM